MDDKHLPWIIGAGALVAFLVFRSSSGGGGSTTVAAPDTSATDQARFGFLGSAVGSLADLEKAITLDAAQLEATRVSAAAGLAAAQAQADASKVASREASRGKRGGGLSLGPFHLNFNF